ncbi:hypothetical protein T08_6008 [Trichinella sp. T8]|nr:hypothetical protein T08_6008 [Trichinella sp. T8]
MSWCVWCHREWPCLTCVFLHCVIFTRALTDSKRQFQLKYYVNRALPSR